MSEDRRTRRSFLTGLASLPLVGGLLLALRVATTPSAVVRPRRVSLGPLAAVPERGLLPRRVSYKLRRGPSVETVSELVYLTRDPANGEVIALSSRCTHLGCTVIHDAGDQDAPLHCPCHEARFAADGRVLEGPPKRPLDRLPIHLPDDPQGLIEWELS